MVKKNQNIWFIIFSFPSSFWRKLFIFPSNHNFFLQWTSPHFPYPLNSFVAAGFLIMTMWLGNKALFPLWHPYSTENMKSISFLACWTSFSIQQISASASSSSFRLLQDHRFSFAYTQTYAVHNIYASQFYILYAGFWYPFLPHTAMRYG